MVLKVGKTYQDFYSVDFSSSSDFRHVHMVIETFLEKEYLPHINAQWKYFEIRALSFQPNPTDYTFSLESLNI